MILQFFTVCVCSFDYMLLIAFLYPSVSDVMIIQDLHSFIMILHHKYIYNCIIFSCSSYYGEFALCEAYHNYVAKYWSGKIWQMYICMLTKLLVVINGQITSALHSKYFKGKLWLGKILAN